MLYGGLVGNVVDAQGAVVPGASVTIVNKDTNLTRETTTDAQGGYSFTNIQAGPYDVKVVLTGFRESVRSRVPVTTGQISRVDLTLAVGNVTESITVQSEAELLQTDKADVHTELKSTEITNLPLNRFRNYQALVALVPGSLPPAFQNAETDTPQRSLNMTVNGQDGAANTTLTDGTRNVNVGLPHHNVYIAPAETIETVNITTGSMDAEEGMAAGVAISVVTKSGTNNFKGSGFEFFNNEKLNATPYYFGRGATPVKLPVERQTFGGTLGGPILRNRLFFFGSYEGYISRQRAFAFFNVPNAALRNGDFSNALNANGTLQQIYDPFTGDMATGTGRSQFANNMIPADRVNPISRQLLALYPLPNVEGTGAGGLTANYREERPSSTDRHNFDLKVNWNRTPAHQLWGKYSHMNALVDDLFTFPLPTADGDGGETKVHLITGGQTWSLGKSLLVDSSIGVSIMNQFCSSPDFALGMMGLDLGIPGTNDQGRGDPRYAGLPQFSSGFTALGNTPTWSPAYRDEGSVSFSTNVTKVAGSHDFRAGYRVDYLTLDNWQPERANPRGGFTFAGNATRTFGTGSQTANFYNTYAAFLLGLVNTASKSFQYELFTGREWQHAMFVRDRWTVKQKLTLDLGLRWEYYPVMTRADRQIEMLDLQTLDVLIGGVGGNPKNMGLKAPMDGFTPRIGAVYRLNDKTVLRSGYGATLDARGMSAQEAFRGDFSYPLVLNASFQPAAGTSTFGWYGTLDQGIPRLEGPDLSSGRVRLPNSYGMQTSVPESTDRGRTHSWNVSFERRLPLNLSADVAYVGNRLVGGLPPAEGQTININTVQHMGGGDTDRPYFASHGRQLDHRDLLALAEDVVPRAPGGPDAAVYPGAAAQRTLHVQPLEGVEDRLRGSHRRGRGTQLGARQRRPAAHVPDGLRLPAALAQRRRPGQHRKSADQRLADQRHPRGVQRLAVHRHRRRDDVEHAGQHADRRPRGPRDEDRRDRRERLLLRPGRVGAARRRSLRNRADQSVPRPRRLEPRPLGLPFVPPGRDASTRGPGRSGQRDEYDEVRQSDQQSAERRLHAHLRPLRRVCGTAGPARRAVQLLGPRLASHAAVGPRSLRSPVEAARFAPR